MKTLVTGSAGRIGRAICARLRQDRPVIGLDCRPSPTTDVVGSIDDVPTVRAALRGVGAVVHTAALHAPHVGHAADAVFTAINVAATERLARLAVEAGAQAFVLTSTTALYGASASAVGPAGWIDEDTVPQPQTIYHRTKLAAECRLEAIAAEGALAVTVIRMSRCFPEPAPRMAAYRLHRGVDARDVAEAHALALDRGTPGFRRFVVSGATPFRPEDVDELAIRAPDVLIRRCPALVDAFRRRGWDLPDRIDRVYVPDRAIAGLGWSPRHGFEAVLSQLDSGSPEVLPMG